ncbi:MAG TPA: mannose-6-phosphate isomerase, class I [Candidatus Ruania gallistercoris]|uniref:mannose-6-phosphate isomerase n=1 Tax=Candidatus Ruania gallistercoris TaxID=2838746 RepID=A0A9D2ECT1_9MICO|nr:mannose-6-phosphate isomerase, class I [Candidatus Ruania gallistercoris]
MLTLVPQPQHYAWGSPEVIPEFLGETATGAPVAEAWYGAHPSAPSETDGGTDLRTHLAQAPELRLGADVVARFGPHLPYLLKLIAPSRPLSLQVHPNLEQAREGFAREEAAGTAQQGRSYHDANHKPELVYALTTFEAVCGFRAPRRAAELLAGLSAPLARELLVRLRAEPSAIGMHAAFGRLLQTGTADQVREVVSQCAERLAAGTSPSQRADAIVTRLAQLHPGDPGAVAALLLNPVTLQPGEVMFVPAGWVHAYLSGFGVEVMANSDNVLRAGLTEKHVDIPELLATVDSVAAPPIRIAPELLTEATGVFYAPVDDFELSLTRLADDPGRRLPGRGPRVLLVLAGQVQVTTADESRTLGRGQAVFVAADEGELQVAGTGTLVQADVP